MRDVPPIREPKQSPGRDSSIEAMTTVRLLGAQNSVPPWITRNDLKSWGD
jgi:hypothetical protein